jgi:hypothetical protein
MNSYPALLSLYLQYFLFPLWLVAGFIDYICHRRRLIESTSGLRESLLHVAQAAQLGIAMLVGLFLEINALTVLLMLGAVVAHSATAFMDVRYTTPRRYISPLEQQVHGYLEVIPIVAVSIVVVLYWDQVGGLFGASDSPVAFSVEMKEKPLPSVYVGVTLGLTLAVQGLPLAEECWRASRALRRAPQASTSASPT